MGDSDPTRRFVVGLGNPGREYQATRHNVGYMVIEALLRRHDFGAGRSKFHGTCWSGQLGSCQVVLLAPETYMNRSGLAVAELTAFYRAAPEQVLVVQDDLALPVGRIRARAGGSAGGHKGLADIIAALGTDQVPRLRVGIGAAPPRMDAADYVLSTFGAEEKQPMAEAIQRAAEAVEDWVSTGITRVMDRYNRDEKGTVDPENGKQE